MYKYLLFLLALLICLIAIYNINIILPINSDSLQDSNNDSSEESSLHLKDLPTGSEGRKRNLLDIARFLDFAVDECGIDIKWKPVGKAYQKKLIGKLEKPKTTTIPIKPDQLFELIDSLFDKPELKLAVSLVGLFGLRPAELIKLNFTKLGIMRPSFLLGKRKEKRVGEKIGIIIFKMLSPFLQGPLKKIRPIHSKKVAKAMLTVAQENLKQTIFESNEIVDLSK